MPADVVLSITKPPVIPGVAGTGGGCASEEAGRPTWIVFAWIQKIVGFPGKTVEELLEEHRPLIIHEIIHGLGFSNIKFRSATDARGERKGLVTLGKVEDLDGAVDAAGGEAGDSARGTRGARSNSEGTLPPPSGNTRARAVSLDSLLGGATSDNEDVWDD